MLDTSCPEFYVTEIGRVVHAGGNNLRIHCCVQVGNALEQVVRLVIPVDRLALNSQKCLQAAIEAHNQLCMFPPKRH